MMMNVASSKKKNWPCKEFSELPGILEAMF
jgi:hypothetical protein